MDVLALAYRDTLKGLETWANRNLTKFSEGKCKEVLHLQRSNSRQHYIPGFT